MDADKKFIVITIIVTIGILVGAVVWATSQTPRVSPDQSIAPEVLISDRTYNTRGSQQAPITIVEFSDPQCPACKDAAQDATSILDQYQGLVKLVYRHFPLPIHNQSIPASRAVEAAGKQGKFNQMLDGIFANQDRLEKEGDALLREIAISIDLNMDQFDQDRKSDEIANIVKNDSDTAMQIGVSYTPSFFINGKLLPSNNNQTRLQSLQDGIKQAMNQINPDTLPITPSSDSAVEATPSSN